MPDSPERKRERRLAARSSAQERHTAALQAAKGLSTVDWISSMALPPGNPRAGLLMTQDLWQASFIQNAFARAVREALLCTGRKNAKTFTCAALALSFLAGPNHFPGVRILCASLTLEHIAELQKAMLTLAETNGIEIENQKTPRPGNLRGPDGAECRFISGAVNNSALSTSADVCFFDEIGTLPESRRSLIEQLKVCLSGRTSVSKFIALSIRGDSILLEEMVEAGKTDPSIYIQMHEGDPNADLLDETNWHRSNPGLKSGIKSIDFMRHAARQAVQNPKLEPTYRALHQNEKLLPDRTPIISLSQWQSALTDNLPPRKGPVIVGIDAGGADSFSAAFLYWPTTGRAESFAMCGGIPDALTRSRHDGQGDLYVHAVRRNELIPLPERRSVNPIAFIQEISDRLEGQKILCVVGDRWRVGDLIDAMRTAHITAPFVPRGLGYESSTSDILAYERYIDEGKIAHKESILQAAAISGSYIEKDGQLNQKLNKLRASKSKTDILQAAVLCIGQAARIEQAKPKRRKRRHYIA